MKKRKGMSIYRLESPEKIIEGDAVDLEHMGIDSCQVRAAVSSGKRYLGYKCTVIGKVEKVTPVKKYNVEQFDLFARNEGKNYAQLQLEETMGRIING